MEIPVIALEPVQSFVVNRIARVHNFDTTIHVEYAIFGREPEINGGATFLAPVVRLIWPTPDLMRCAGSVAAWLHSGCQEFKIEIPRRHLV